MGVHSFSGIDITVLRTMKQSKIVGIIAAVVFAVLWVFPVIRAVSFFSHSLEYFHDTGSINASTDLRYSFWLLACYLGSLSTALAFSWLITWRPRLPLLLPGTLLVYAAAEVVWLRPESPIHLFPAMTPFRPVYISAVAVAIAAGFIFFPRQACRGRTA